MIKTLNKVYPFYILLDIICIILSFLISYTIRYQDTIHLQRSLPYYREYFFPFILWAILIVIAFKRRTLYSTDRSLTIPTEIFKSITAIFYVSILMATIIFFAKYEFFSRQIFFINFLLLCFFLSSWRVIKRLILRKLILEGFHNFNVLIIGAGNTGKIVLEEIEKKPWWGYRVIGFLDDVAEIEVNGKSVLGKLKDFPVIAKKYFVDEVIITIPSERSVVSELMKQARRLRLGVRLVPQNFEEPISDVQINYLGFLPLITYKERKIHPTNLFLKRLMDLAISLFLIIVFFPLFIITSFLIKSDSPGPILFVQKRAGLKGKTFKLYKLRSMTEDAEKLKPSLLEKNEVKDGVIFKIKKDPRKTKLGALLRRFSIDELPQLFNVLKGEMSLVGPRPPTPDEVTKYNHFHMDRLSIRPGITGLSQIKARNKLNFKSWVKWDLWYVNHWSFRLDLRILWMTIPAVIKGEGAY